MQMDGARGFLSRIRTQPAYTESMTDICPCNIARTEMTLSRTGKSSVKMIQLSEIWPISFCANSDPKESDAFSMHLLDYPKPRDS